jgi:hypothetical protein
MRKSKNHTESIKMYRIALLGESFIIFITHSTPGIEEEAVLHVLRSIHMPCHKVPGTSLLSLSEMR